MNTLSQVQEALALSQPLRERSSTKDITRVTPVQLLQITGLVSLGRLCLQAAGQLLGRRRLPSRCRGRPEVYAALTIWLTAIIQRLKNPVSGARKPQLTLGKQHLLALTRYFACSFC